MLKALRHHPTKFIFLGDKGLVIYVPLCESLYKSVVCFEHLTASEAAT